MIRKRYRPLPPTFVRFFRMWVAEDAKLEPTARHKSALYLLNTVRRVYGQYSGEARMVQRYNMRCWRATAQAQWFYRLTPATLGVLKQEAATVITDRSFA